MPPLLQGDFLGDYSARRFYRSCVTDHASRFLLFCEALDPTGFAKSKTVGVHFGLTSRRIQSGETIDIDGHISKCGDGEVRTALYEAASAMFVRSKKCAA